MHIIDVHIHGGHRFEWTDMAKEAWMEQHPHIAHIFDEGERQQPQEYGDTIRKEGVWGGMQNP